MTQTYKNWRLETDTDQILWLYFDKQKASVNTLNHEVMGEFSALLIRLRVILHTKVSSLRPAKKMVLLLVRILLNLPNLKILKKPLLH